MQAVALGLGPCLILTLWMAGSSPPAAVPTRSPDSSAWWDQDSIPLQKKALRLRKAGDFRAAEDLYRQGYDEAMRRGDQLAAVRFLMSVGGCQFGQFRYREALSTYLNARELAVAARDAEDLGAIAGNLSSVYFHVWDIPAAMRAAEEGLAALSRNNSAAHPHSYFEAQLLMQLGRLHAQIGDPETQHDYAAAIAAARAQDNGITTETLGWDLLGEQRLAARDFNGAGRAFLEAFRLRTLFNPAEIGFSHGRLGALEYSQSHLEAAALHTNRALAVARRHGLAQPEYILLHQRGRIRLGLGDADGALQDFSQAVDAASRWRLQVPAARSVLAGANAGLDEQIFRSYIETAAHRAVRTGNHEWAEKAFQAAELNRTASLREGLALSEAWRKNLPAEYWEVLGQISAEQAQQLRGSRPSVRNARLHLKLTEMEAEAGRGLVPKIAENFRSQTSLIHFRNGLSVSELFLSFWLGRNESYLWAVDRDSLKLYRLPARQEIENAVQVFREALSNGRPEAVQKGQHLYSLLFGQLGPRETSKKAWLLSLEGVLFEAPFAAMVPEQGNGRVAYLVEKHSIQTVPGALLLRGGTHERNGSFVGVGDPIYNMADSRWNGPRPSVKAEGQLERLVGSGREVEVSARDWSTNTPPGAQRGWTVLQGSDATRGNFLRLLDHRPAAIHLATHVLIPPQDREQGFVAFSLSSAQDHAPRPDYLSAWEIASLSVPGSLVVMTGCASGTGTVRAGAGLLGLTRAWLMAGASNVIATAWPVEDTSGDFFGRFYHHLRTHSVAEALRRSQLEEIHSGTWRQAPTHWASYQVTGGSH